MKSPIIKDVLIVIQQHSLSGQRNMCLTDDPDISLKDLIVRSGGWEDAPVIMGRVMISGDPDVLDALLHTEFRSVDNAHDIVAITPGQALGIHADNTPLHHN